MDNPVTQFPPGARILLHCPLLCGWQYEETALPPGGPFADHWDALRLHFAAAEDVVRAHLETHSLLEWVQEVMRLRDQAAGTVTVNRDDLAEVHGYARQFDVGSDPSMKRVAALLAGTS